MLSCKYIEGKYVLIMDFPEFRKLFDMMGRDSTIPMCFDAGSVRNGVQKFMHKAFGAMRAELINTSGIEGTMKGRGSDFSEGVE